MAGRRICAGYYRRYDGKVVYVVSLATDSDTGEETEAIDNIPDRRDNAHRRRALRSVVLPDHDHIDKAEDAAHERAAESSGEIFQIDFTELVVYKIHNVPPNTALQ